MNNIRVANAPCSWGALEFEDMEGEQIAYPQMLDELRDTGYTGTELGDWGFMPTEPELLAQELDKRDLAMVAAFVPIAFKYPEAQAPGEVEALKVARLLASVAEKGERARPPFLVLADDNGADPLRTKFAGRITPEMGLSLSEWATFTQGAERVARAVRDETGLLTVFHPHSAGYIETPGEIARFLEMTDSDLIGLAFDTGHYLYGTGTNDGERVLQALDRFGARIRHMHFKDCQPEVAGRARTDGWDYFTAVRHGLFCELGRGVVPFKEVAAWLEAHNYHGWIVVEQDVLPGMGNPKVSAQRNRDYLRAVSRFAG
ncbi:MAG: TIM barrel protein [Chloroflexi bacterium]|nr:TIM barrel protein [Chloroflexota bacterium]